MNRGSAIKWAELVRNHPKLFHYGLLKDDYSYCLIGILEDFISPMTKRSWDDISYITEDGSSMIPSMKTISKCKFKTGMDKLIPEFENRISFYNWCNKGDPCKANEDLANYILENYERF